MEDASLPLSNPLAHDDPDNYGSTLSWSNRNGQRSSMRLTTKKSVNYSERALEQAALGAAGEVWSSQHPPSDEEVFFLTLSAPPSRFNSFLRRKKLHGLNLRKNDSWTRTIDSRLTSAPLLNS